jgi:bacterial/archaeal transporter family-2 protein
MFNLAWPSALALIAGVSVVIQQVLNANLRSELNSAVWSGFMSYFLGVLCMVSLAIVLREPIPSGAVITRIPWWSWSGGLFGAIFIGLSILVAQQLGAAALIALLVTGQMIASVVIDHFGWLGLVQRPVDPARLIGVGLLIGGVLLIRR